jgi:hypothetical protein
MEEPVHPVGTALADFEEEIGDLVPISGAGALGTVYGTSWRRSWRVGRELVRR